MTEIESLRALRRACEEWVNRSEPAPRMTIRAALRACESATPEVERAAGLLEKIADLTENGERLKATADSAAEHARDMVDAVAGPLRVELSAARAEVERLRSAIRWALGHDEGDPPFDPPEDADRRRYWWRDELRRRAGIDATEGWRLASEPPDSARDVLVWMPDRLNKGVAAIGYYLNGSWSPRYTGSPITHWRDIEPPEVAKAACVPMKIRVLGPSLYFEGRVDAPDDEKTEPQA